MTSKTTTKTTSPKTNRKHSRKQRPLKHSVKKSNRINRQRRLQKQLQAAPPERHSRRCIICHHPEREAIEEEFVHWRAPGSSLRTTSSTTTAPSTATPAPPACSSSAANVCTPPWTPSSIRRRRNFHGDTILRAMRAYSCIDSHGRWTEIPTQVEFSTSNDPTHRSRPPALRMSLRM